MASAIVPHPGHGYYLVQINDLLKKQGRGIVEWTIERTGPDHAPKFSAAPSIEGVYLPTCVGTGSQKQTAKEGAAVLIATTMPDLILAGLSGSSHPLLVETGMPEVLPQTMATPVEIDLTQKTKRHGQYPVNFGGFADIWTGYYFSEGQSTVKVALKQLRRHIMTDEKLRQRLNKEMDLWTQLNHPNILRLLGYSRPQPDTIYLVSPWLHHGHVMDYIRAYSHCNRLKLISDIANGLEYLHSRKPQVIHGDIKGANVLVDDNGRAVLCDFGLSTFVTGHDITTTSASLGSWRWMAPERIQPLAFDLTYSTSRRAPSDVFSFGMTSLEIISGARPFADLNDFQAMMATVGGERPDLPRAVTEDTAVSAVHGLISRCWAQHPCERPHADDNVRDLYTLTFKDTSSNEP